NLLGIDEFTLPQRAHPGACARQREDECLVDPTGLRSRSASNEDLLALAGTVRRESKPKRVWAVALIAAVDSAACLWRPFLVSRFSAADFNGMRRRRAGRPSQEGCLAAAA